jgi:hypothetical protein
VTYSSMADIGLSFNEVLLLLLDRWLPCASRVVREKASVRLIALMILVADSFASSEDKHNGFERSIVNRSPNVGNGVLAV